MLERAETALGVDRPFVDTDREKAEHLRAGANRNDVKGLRWTACADPHLAGRRLRERGRHVDALRHPVGRLPQSPHAVSVRRVKSGPSSGE